MKAIVSAMLLVASMTANAELENGPLDYYLMDNLISNKVVVELVTTNNVYERCNQENRAQGFLEFTNNNFEACAFWRASEG